MSVARDYGRARNYSRVEPPKKLRLIVIDDGRPRTRAECAEVPRPCPYVSCRWHLYIEARRESIKLNFPGLEVWELSESCALDVADSGPHTLEAIAQILGVTNERVRQLEARAIAKLSKTAKRRCK